MKRRAKPADGLPTVPALGMGSVILAKCPLLREFLSATTYEDSTLRTPGYVTWRNRGYAYEITLYDPDSGMRLPVRHPEIDKLFGLVETMLGAEDAQWEVDQYLSEQLAKKQKRKKGA